MPAATNETSSRDNGFSTTAKTDGRVTVQEKVLASLQYGLMSGLFVPGQVLSLRKLAASLGTSPMPVRECLSRLVAARALEELPNRSVGVPRLGVKGLRELFEVRCHIEGMAARIVSEDASEALLTELSAINDRLLAAHRRQDMAQVLVANQAFHFAIYNAANSDILMPLIESLWLRCGPTMYFSFNAPNNLWDTSTHLEMLEALRLHDGPRAQGAMQADIQKTADYLIKEASSQRASGPFASLAKITG
ncbi:GntR family transcriptional regulator [Humitalea sp. 24SJ18S-53]|uniref:GntR family transcriptional regulator n=1 Tax=Humitalea sp. 24SJ18S-53 TaxID=3422307 RepID=UPI003D66D8C9